MDPLEGISPYLTTEVQVDETISFGMTYSKASPAAAKGGKTGIPTWGAIQ